MKKNEEKILKYLIILNLIIFGFESTVFAVDLDCSTYGSVLVDIQNVFDFAKIVVPLLVIGLSSYDFIKAITSKEAKDVKKAFNILIKRFAYAIIFFFLPILINFLLKLISIDSNTCVR